MYTQKNNKSMGAGLKKLERKFENFSRSDRSENSSRRHYNLDSYQVAQCPDKISSTIYLDQAGAPNNIIQRMPASEIDADHIVIKPILKETGKLTNDKRKYIIDTIQELEKINYVLHSVVMTKKDVRHINKSDIENNVVLNAPNEQDSFKAGPARTFPEQKLSQREHEIRTQLYLEFDHLGKKISHLVGSYDFQDMAISLKDPKHLAVNIELDALFEKLNKMEQSRDVRKTMQLFLEFIHLVKLLTLLRSDCVRAQRRKNLENLLKLSKRLCDILIHENYRIEHCDVEEYLPMGDI